MNYLAKISYFYKNMVIALKKDEILTGLLLADRFGIKGDFWQELWDSALADEARVQVLRLEEEWRASYSEVLKKVREFKEEIPIEERQRARREFLEGVEAEVQAKVGRLARAKELMAEIFPFDDDLAAAQKKHKRLSFELNMLKSGKVLARSEKDIDEYTIARCLELPLGDFLPMASAYDDGERVKYRCCFHDDKEPSFCWYKRTNSFYCFGCGCGGDAITLARKLYDYSFVEAVKFLRGYL